MNARAQEPVDREARERASLDLDRSLCVEAGAGTGKTTLLVRRFLAIVESGRASADEIVAITFTEKAADEMKLRIRVEIERRLERDDSDVETRRRLEAARDCLERAPISTIHAFAASILREYPLEAGIDPRFAQLDAVEGELFFDECWSDFLLRRASSHEDAIRRFMVYGGHPDRLFDMARAMYNRRGARVCGGIFDAERNGPAEPRGAETRAGSPRLDRAAETLRAEILDRVEKLRALASGNCRNPADKGFLCIEEFARETEPLVVLDGEDLERFLFFLEIPSPKGNKANWRPQEACAEQKTCFREMAELQRALRTQIMDDVAQALGGLFGDFLRFADERKDSEGVLDFDDLLIRARKLCAKETALEALRRRYRFILVDEFQDTDPVQAEIVWLLACGAGGSAPDPGRLFIVGDPKQSIYRFRRADVETYERVKERLVLRGGGLISIIQNFRSVPGIVAWVNETFSAAMRPPPDGRYQPRYEEIAPARSGAGTPVVAFDLEMGDERPSSDDIRRLEAEAIPRIIHRLVSSGMEVGRPASGGAKRIGYGDIAVLYPAATAMEWYEDRLRAEGIPYVVEGGKLYYTREEVRALASAVWAIEDPYDRLALVGALRSPLFGANDEELFLFTRTGGRLDYLDPGAPEAGKFRDILDAFSLLRELHASRNEAGPVRTVLALLANTKFRELSLLRPHGEQRVANIRKAISSARSFEGIAGGYRRFARWFRDQEILAAEEGESPVVEEDGDGVKLLTMHRAKGLQFPVVILANLVQARGRHSRIIVGPGDRLAFRIGNGCETSDFETLDSGERLRDEAERIRLLYVAATRAGDLLVVPRVPKSGGCYDIIGQTLAPVSADGRVAEWRLSEMPPLRGEARSFARLEEPSAEERERSGRLRDEWRRERLALIGRASRATVRIAPSRFSGSDLKDETPLRAAAGSARDSAGGKRAAIFGEAFHRVMERSLGKEPPSLRRLCAAVSSELGVEESEMELARLAEAALESDLLRRAARSPRLFREAPFILPASGGFVEGRIDLAFEEEGRWTIVDYKTDAIAPEEVEGRLDRYRPQAALYAFAARRLGFEGPGEIAIFFVRPLIARVIAATEELAAEAEALIRSAAGGPPL